MFRVYRPAGNTILLKTSPFGEKHFAPYRFTFYQSGTAALSAAIAASIKVNGGVAEESEIILPAYACPDLVSAVLYAGAIPVLVDLAEDSSYFSLDKLSRAISVKTVAIIAVNFLGISERIKKLRLICEKQNLLLIVDSAQWFTTNKLQEEWSGDFNVISFGRGKPVNLLHGGAVITSKNIYHDTLQKKPPAHYSSIEHLKQILKIVTYNIVIQPLVYGIVSIIPGLHIGRTIFKPLNSISAMNHFHIKLIERNMSKLNNQHLISLIHKKLALISNHILLDLLPDSTDANNALMLRYPILIKDKLVRDKFLEKAKNYGVSALYQRPLNQIAGLEEILDHTLHYPNANQFAEHLVTLPTHEDVDSNLLNMIFLILEECLNNSNVV